MRAATRLREIAGRKARLVLLSEGQRRSFSANPLWRHLPLLLALDLVPAGSGRAARMLLSLFSPGRSAKGR